MNKYIIEGFGDNPISFDKNSGYGSIRGYEVNIYYTPTQTGPLLCISSYLSPEKKDALVKRIEDHKFKLVTVAPTPFGIAVVLGAMTSKSFVKNAPGVIDAVFNDLQEMGGLNSEYCPYSGEALTEETSKMVTIPELKSKVRLLLTSVDSINIDIEESDREYAESQNNYFKGFLGILIGAIAGIVITSILASAGFVSAISSVVAVYIGVLLYKKFGGKPNAWMIVMSFVTTAVFILGYVYISYSSLATSYVIENSIILGDANALTYCLANFEEFAEAFRTDMLYNVLFIVIGEAAMIGQLVRSLKRPKKL